MSATKSKPAGRAVKVRKHNAWCKESGGIDALRSGHFVEGYTGSARRLKRLAEIAGMDGRTLAAFLTDEGYGLEERMAISRFMGHWERVSLSTAQGHKGKKP